MLLPVISKMLDGFAEISCNTIVQVTLMTAEFHYLNIFDDIIFMESVISELLNYSLNCFLLILSFGN